MTPIPYIHDYTALSVPERIVLAQDLWDSVIGEAETLPLNPSEAQWLKQRITYADRLDAEWFGLQEILAGIHSRRQDR